MVIGCEGTGGSYHYFLYRMSRASQAVSAVDGRDRLVPEPASSEDAEG
jgi:hypothetical protein